MAALGGGSCGRRRLRPRRRMAGTPARATPLPAPAMKERLQKLLARAGHGSRRSAEKLIVAGRVSVNGAVVRQLGTQVDDTDRVEVDGIELTRAIELAYLAMHKPHGFVTTARDPQRRRTIMELLPT